MLVHNRYRSAAPSGENRVVDQEAEALAALGHEVTHFERRSDDIANWPVLKKASLPGRILWNPEVHRAMVAALNTSKPDVVHVHNTFPLLSIAVLEACHDASVPVVATIHNKRLVCASGDLFRDGRVCHDCLHGSAARAVAHGCYRDSRAATTWMVVANSVHRRAWQSLISAYIFVSTAQRDLHANLRLPHDRVFVRYHLIPRHDTEPGQSEPLVLYAGRLDTAKGVRVLMAGWDEYLAHSSASQLRLAIAGAGSLEKEVALWASSRNSVDVLGMVSSDRCAQLMSQARAVIIPSAVEETFGLVAVEAMAQGVPPIAAGHGSFAELITPGVNGVLFPPGDHVALGLVLRELEKAPGEYEIYGHNARKTYEQRFDPYRALEELIKIYNFAISHPA